MIAHLHLVSDTSAVATFVSLVTYHFQFLALRKVQQLVLPANARVSIQPLDHKGISLRENAHLLRAALCAENYAGLLLLGDGAGRLAPTHTMFTST